MHAEIFPLFNAVKNALVSQLPANELAGLLEANPGNTRIATWTVAITTYPDTANLIVSLSHTTRGPPIRWAVS